MIERMKQLLKYSKRRAVSGNLLMMDGMDHMEIEPRLSEIMDILNNGIKEIELKHSTMEDYVRAQYASGADLGEIKGELYHSGVAGLNNGVAKGCLSAAAHLKQMNNECEILLTRWAEPFDVIANLVRPQNRKGFFDTAWTYLLKNHPHDSICGCSITRVHQDNEYRFNQVMDIAGELIDMELKDIASSVDTSASGKPNSIVLFNASQADYNGIVEVELEFDAGSSGNFNIFTPDGRTEACQVLDTRKNTLKIDHKPGYIYQGWPRRDIYRVAFSARIPSMGYSTYAYEEYKNVGPFEGDFTYREYHEPVRYLGSMQTGHNTWENEHIRVTFEKSGSITVINKATGKEYRDLLIFEDTAETGNAWVIKAPVKFSRYMSLGGRCDFSVESNGPIVASFKLTHFIDLPKKMDEHGISRSAEFEEFRIVTYITMKKGSPVLDFKSQIDNTVEEHRLRVLFPTYINTDTFSSLTPFYLEDRTVKKPDWSSWCEEEAGVFANQGIAMMRDDRDCLALYNKGLYEIEVTEDISRTFALSLFRSFKREVARDMGDMTLMKRRMTFEYALEFGTNEKLPGDIVVSGEMWRTGTRFVCTDSHYGALEPVNSYLKLDMPNAVLSSYRMGRVGMTVMRLYNCDDSSTSGILRIYKKPLKVFRLDLNEGVVEEMGFEGNVIPLELKPAQIITLSFHMEQQGT